MLKIARAFTPKPTKHLQRRNLHGLLAASGRPTYVLNQNHHPSFRGVSKLTPRDLVPQGEAEGGALEVIEEEHVHAEHAVRSGLFDNFGIFTRDRCFY